jgi:dolichyl-phosphate beta-glucosyltransferase
LSHTCAIVVPCYNEASRLSVEIFRGFTARSPHVTFIFVNDGSTDNTLQALERMREGMEASITVIDCKQNVGKAEAVRRGLLHALDHAQTAVVGFWDADLATPLEAIDDLLEVLRQLPEVQLVFGARVKLLGRDIERRPARHYLGRVFATVVSVLLRLPIYDTQCGAKLFRVTPELRSILNEPFHSRWVFDVEIIARFLQLHRTNPAAAQCAIYEFPLHAWRDVGGSKLRPGDFVKAAVEVFHICRRYR